MIGTTISHYRVIRKLGEGGMGEVYLAQDSILGREVALKFISGTFAADPASLSRFEREAKLLASLNHPNIAVVHGLEEAEGNRFLVMELVEGETLAEKIGKRRLPVGEALDICRQIVVGVEAAHEKGIIHRDLKPANVKITPAGRVKVLDFGLAKALAADAAGATADESPTKTSPAVTRAGTILGTPAYMSPEQATGKVLGAQADIWAFGCIVFECLTGRRAFQGDTVTETLAAVLKGDPDWKSLPQEASAQIRNALQRCLQKDPKLRYRNIDDAWLDFEAPAALSPDHLDARRRFSIPWIAACTVVALVAGVAGGWAWRHRVQNVPSAPVVATTVKVEPGYHLGVARAATLGFHPARTAMAISSDGSFVVYAATAESDAARQQSQLFLRRMDKQGASPIAGTEGAVSPFLSPDGRWVGFYDGDKLKKVPVEGGVAVTLCDAPFSVGASWGPDNSIVFAGPHRSGLMRVSADGGTPEILTTPDPKREESGHRMPAWLPDGTAVLFTVMKHPWDRRPSLALLRLDTREWRVLLPDAANARYVRTGHLVFLRQGTLMAVRFDEASLQIVGQPAPLVEDVIQAFGRHTSANSAEGQFGISDTGSLIYASGGVLPDPKNSLVWVDRTGVERPVTDLKLAFGTPRLSPDGLKIVYSTGGGQWQVYVFDLVTGANHPLTEDGMAQWPIWAPDGERVVFAWRRSRASNLFWQPHDGRTAMARITTSDNDQYAGSWAPDGNTIALAEAHSEFAFHVSLLDVRSGRVAPFIDTKTDSRHPDFSPDGRFLAYVSGTEVYLRPVSGSGVSQVSDKGGLEPLWARDGKQLFYRRGNAVWAVDVQTQGGVRTSKPRLLFERPGYLTTNPIRCWDVSRDGRFLMVKEDESTPGPVTEMTLVQNWFHELERLLPTARR